MVVIIPMSKRLEVKPGDRYGRWVIVEEVERGYGTRRFKCICDCGNEDVTRLTHMRQGLSKSCGCIRKENLTSHGMYNKRIYQSWADMKTRCLNVNNKFYERYGGRGISVCDEWLKFEPFYKWSMENGYQDNLTIERNDNDGNYCPENCSWITQHMQTQNRNQSRFITYNGMTKNITQWSKYLGISRETLYYRLSHGWNVSRAFNAPSQRTGS